MADTAMDDWTGFLFDVKTCEGCKGPSSERAVYRGSTTASILIVGQAPGREEARQGLPFVGPAGKMLDEALARLGLTEQDVLITNPVTFWPRNPDDRKPTPEEISHGRMHLDWIVEKLKPKLIITLGDVAARLFVDSPWGIMKLSGSLQPGNVFPIIHPAAVLHNPASRPIWEQSWKNLQPVLVRITGAQPDEERKPVAFGQEQPFVHLHVHTEYSKLDGHQTVEELVDEAKAIGFRTLALTDHGTLAGWIHFYRYCEEVGIKPILGVEAYIAENRASKEYMHLVILAENLDGYRSIIKVQSHASLNAVGKPIIQWDELNQLKGVIVLTACTSGVFGKPVFQDNDAVRATKNVQRLIDVFGKRNVFIEVQPHTEPTDPKKPWPMQLQLNKAAVVAAKELGIGLVATGDTHYTAPDGWKVQDVMLAIRDNKTLDFPDRFRYDVHDLYVRDAQTVLDGLVLSGLSEADAKRAMDFTLDIAGRCSTELPRGKNIMPKPPVPTGVDPEEFFEQLVKDGFKHRLPDKIDDPVYKARLDYEMGLYISKGFVDYMLIVWELLDWCKKNNVTPGPGRGSVSGSLVAYIIGVTDVDPIYHDIIMERFISEVRTDMPDIDLDFEDEKRNMAIQHLRDVYGQDNVVKLGTEVRMKGRSVIRDVCRVLGIPKEEADPVAASIIYRSGGDARANYSIEDSFGQFEACKQFDRKHPTVRRYAVQLEGRVRNYGTHASGVLMTPWPLTDGVALERRNDEITSAWTMEDAEYLGLLKLDILGITGLTIIRTCLELVEKRTGTKLDMASIPLDDEKTLDAFAHRETVGVFQFGSLGLRRLTERLGKAKGGKLTFDDLAALNTLHRPAVLNIGMHQEYIYRVDGRHPVTYRHPVLEKLLGKTFGIAIYQEQIMMICRELGGLTWEHVGLVRKIISKRQGVEIFQKARQVFVDGAAKNGCPTDVATEVFNEISHAGSYAFNRAHAISYSMLAYRQMWLKVHYPLEYHAALLMCENDETEKSGYVRSARRFGIQVLPPDVNGSGVNYRIDGDSIRCGLGSIENVGIAASQIIIKRQPYTSLIDFQLRVDRRLVHSRVTERLIMAGAFKSLHPNTKALLAVWKGVSEEVMKNGADDKGHQRTLDGEMAFVPNSLDKLKLLIFEDEYTPEEELEEMLKVVHFPTEQHPFEKYKEEEMSMVSPVNFITPIKDLDFDAGHGNVLVGGIVTEQNWKIEGLEGGAYRDVGSGSDMEGHKYVHLNIEDGTDFVMTHFDKYMYQKYKAILERKIGYPLLAEGYIRPGMSKIYVGNFTLLKEWAEKVAKGEQLTAFEKRLLHHPMEDLAGWKLPSTCRIWDLEALWPLGFKVRVLALPAWAVQRENSLQLGIQDIKDGKVVGKLIVVYMDAGIKYGEELKSGIPCLIELSPLKEDNVWCISLRSGCKVQYAHEVEVEVRT